MKNAVLSLFEKSYLRVNPLPSFRAGDTVAVHLKISEGTDKDGKPKFRTQIFEGVCLRFRRGLTSSTFSVRKVASGGIGVDRDFFVNSPIVEKVDIKARGKVRRSRIYYVKNLKGKAARIASRYHSEDVVSQ